MLETCMLAQMAGPVEQGVKGISILPVALGILILVLLFIDHLYHRRRAQRMGYRSWSDYLNSVPRNDAEKRAAVDMAARGLVLCLLGVLFPPLVIVGLFPLYRGVRKLALVAVGVAPTPPAEPAGGSQVQH